MYIAVKMIYTVIGNVVEGVDEFLVETEKYMDYLSYMIHQPNPIIDIFMYTIGILSMLIILYLVFNTKHTY